MDIIFVRTRWHYDSYIDFWRLVELSGFPTCYTDEVAIDKDVVYIVSPYNGEWRPVIDSQRGRERKAKLYMINLERPSGSGSIERYIRDNREHIELGYLDNIFVCDANLSRITGFPFMMIGGHEDFGAVGNKNNKIYDFITLSCYSNHRAWMFQTPEKLYPVLGNMKVATNASPNNPLREILLMGTKAMLNIHQDGLPFCEPLRMIIAIMYGLPIFTEDCDTHLYCTYKFSKFSEYATTMKRMLDNDYSILYEEAIVARQIFSYDNSFRNSVMRAL